MMWHFLVEGYQYDNAGWAKFQATLFDISSLDYGIASRPKPVSGCKDREDEVGAHQDGNGPQSPIV